LVTKAVSGAGRAGPRSLYLVGTCDIELWGLTPLERHARAFPRAGVTAVRGAGQPPPEEGAVIMVRSEYVLAAELVQALAETPGVILAVEDERPGEWLAVAAHIDAAQAGEVEALLARGELGGEDQLPANLRVLSPEELGPSYNRSLRKRAVPFVLPLSEDSRAEIEKKTFAAVYKGATDFVTKWCWPVPARWVTRWAAERRISPNTITTVSLIFVLLAMYLFAEGYFLLGVAAGWFMTFLDTVDGKLARVTMTSSEWGNVYDHGIDLIHPPFWWWAWWQGLQQVETAAAPATLDLALWIIVVGYIVGRLLEGVFRWTFKIEIHIWRSVDYVFRTITARRNPHLAILMVATLLGRPDLGFLAVAVWTVLSIAFHLERIVEAALVRAGGGRITSWLSELG
jgi:phosphatidylglycerophosphate synthase